MSLLPFKTFTKTKIKNSKNQHQVAARQESETSNRQLQLPSTTPNKTKQIHIPSPKQAFRFNYKVELDGKTIRDKPNLTPQITKPNHRQNYHHPEVI